MLTKNGVNSDPVTDTSTCANTPHVAAMKPFRMDMVL